MSVETRPPQFFLRLFRWFCHPRMRGYIEGDLMEVYYVRLEKLGKQQADLKFIIDILLLFRPGIIRPIEGYRSLNSYGMFKSYFKIGYRNLIKNKGYSFINIGGLAIGMAVAMLISLWVIDELSYNKFHNNYDRIAQVMFHAEYEWSEGLETNSVVTTGLGTFLKENYAAQFKNVVLVRARLEERIFSHNNDHFIEHGYYMQPAGPEMLGLKMVSGSINGLNSLTSVLVSQSLAEKIFGGKDPVGEVVRFNDQADLEIKGVYEDLPKNSTFGEAAYLAPLDLFLYGWSDLQQWSNQNMFLFVELQKEVDIAQASALIRNVINDHSDREMDFELFLHPMSKWRLYANFENGEIVTSERILFVLFYSGIGVVILLLACVNFMNLSTAKSENRAKEIGVRKSMGSVRFQLISQFLSESILVTFLAFINSLILVTLSLSWFNELAGKQMTIPWSSPVFWLGALGFTLFTGIVAGSYPAFYLSSFNPVRSLKGTFKPSKYTSLPRKILVVFQFTASIILIIGTVIIYQQIQFVKDRPVGYMRDGLLMMQKRAEALFGKYDVIRNELIKSGVVEEIGEANYPLTNTLGNNDGFSWEGMDPGNNISFNTIRVNYDYGKAVGWDLVAGRDFSRKYGTDKQGIIITQSALDKMKLEDPIGKTITSTYDYWGGHEFVIIGVVKDLIKGDPFEASYPAIMFLTDREMSWQFIRIRNGYPVNEAIARIEQIYKKIAPDAYTDFKIMQDEYSYKFMAEERVGKLATFFSTLAIIISCLGLFGLAAYLTQKRAKEIGIRKVLGASINRIWQLLTKEFANLVIISSLLACPLAYYLIEKWIAGYSYKMEISLWVFFWVSFSSLMIAIATVSFHSIKSALANPVNSLQE